VDWAGARLDAEDPKEEHGRVGSELEFELVAVISATRKILFARGAGHLALGWSVLFVCALFCVSLSLSVSLCVRPSVSFLLILVLHSHSHLHFSTAPSLYLVILIFTLFIVARISSLLTQFSRSSFPASLTRRFSITASHCHTSRTSFCKTSILVGSRKVY